MQPIINTVARTALSHVGNTMYNNNNTTILMMHSLLLLGTS